MAHISGSWHTFCGTVVQRELEQPPVVGSAEEAGSGLRDRQDQFQIPSGRPQKERAGTREDARPRGRPQGVGSYNPHPDPESSLGGTPGELAGGGRLRYLLGRLDCGGDDGPEARGQAFPPVNELVDLDMHLLADRRHAISIATSSPDRTARGRRLLPLSFCRSTPRRNRL
jgi:hypothetical protein